MSSHTASQRYLSTRGGAYDVFMSPPRDNVYFADFSHSSDSKRLYSKALQLTAVSSSQKGSPSLTLTGFRNGGISASTS